MTRQEECGENFVNRPTTATDADVSCPLRGSGVSVIVGDRVILDRTYSEGENSCPSHADLPPGTTYI